MARKHSVSPNQTALWTYAALAPEWGSPALRLPRPQRGTARKARQDSRHTASTQSRTGASQPRQTDHHASRATVLTAEQGTCAQVSQQSASRAGAHVGCGRRRSVSDDLV